MDKTKLLHVFGRSYADDPLELFAEIELVGKARKGGNIPDFNARRRIHQRFGKVDPCFEQVLLKRMAGIFAEQLAQICLGDMEPAAKPLQGKGIA